MSILLSINNYFYRRGGAEVVFLEQNRLFEEAGWQVVPFAMQHSKNLPSEWDQWFVREIEFGEQYSLMRKLASAAKITYSFEARRKIAELASRTSPRLAHAHNIYHHISPAIFSQLKQLDIPTVLTLHDLKIACPAYKMLAHDGVCERCKSGRIWNVALHRCVKDSLPLSMVIYLETLVNRLLGSYSRNVDRFVVPSRFYIDKFSEWGWPRERFTYIPNFVDTESLLPRGKPGNRFVFFGRLGPEKGLETFIRAIALSHTQGAIVGTGPEEGRLRTLAAELQADVEFLGFRSGDSLFNTVREARAVVLPSEWYENAPISILESYALERPVIGARIGGIPELIRPGETGEVFESGQADSLAACLSRFSAMSDQAVLAMGKAGRDWVTNDFTSIRYRDRLLAMYSDMGVPC